MNMDSKSLEKVSNETEFDCVVKIKPEAGCEDLMPSKAHETDAAYDLRAAEDATMYHGEIKIVSAGFKMQLPVGWEAQIRSRSGLSIKGLTVKNGVGTIDSGYRDVLRCILTYDPNTMDDNLNKFTIKRGDRIAQMVISRIPTTKLLVVDSLEDSDRGEKGLGSTGVK